MTNKNKNIALVIGFVFLLTLSYLLTISKTIEQKKQYQTLKEQEMLFKSAPKQLSLLKQKEVYYDSLLTKYQLDGSSVQNNLLKTINTFASTNNLKVIRFLEPHILSKENLTIKTYRFTVEGQFNAINQLIYQLEKETKFGEVINFHFEKKKNYKTGKYFLEASILIKSYG